MKPLYLIASSCMSAQNTLDGMDLDPIILSERNMLSAFPCDFKQYVNPVQIRRMSKVLKMGFATALHCLHQYPEYKPQAIAVGTGKGSLSDTEQFLKDIKTFQESSLNSVPFIQSTYNQLSGMIALNQKIDSYNTTYVHRAFSLETAMLDMQMYFAETETAYALVGSYDEITVEHFQVKKQWGYWKSDIVTNRELLQSKTPGTIAGEGSGFFLLSKEKLPHTKVSLLGLQMHYKLAEDDLAHQLLTFLKHHGLEANQIDLLISGWNGDASVASAYALMESLLPQASVAYFKHLSGEYDTAVHVGIHLLQHILQTQNIPTYAEAKLNLSQKGIRYALIYNNYFQINQSFWLFRYEH